MSNFKETARCTNDPELKFLPNGGMAVCEFSIAVDRYNAKKLKDENKQHCDFIRQVAFGKTAEYLGSNLKKGEFVQVEGDVQIDKVEDKYYTKVKINQAKIITWGNKDNGSNTDHSQEFQDIDNDPDMPF